MRSVKTSSIMYKASREKGFTLVEMMIVLSIIGLLSVVVITSTTLSRAKTRDTVRMNDMRAIGIGLALYYDVNKIYPASMSTLSAVGQGYLPTIPKDPVTKVDYEYLAAVDGKSYCLGVKLESSIPNDSATCTSQSSGSTANYKAQNQR